MNEFDTEELGYEIFYNHEFDRIPYIFRFGKQRLKTMGITLGVLAGAILIMLMVIPWTQKLNEGGLGGTTFQYATYSLPLFIAIAICALCAIALLFWIGLSIEFEKRAHRIATVKHREYRDEYVRRLQLQNQEIKRKYENYT